MAEIKYKDFDLLVEREGENKYRVRVLSSPAGQATGEFSLPFSGLEIENFVLKISRTRRGVRRLESPEMDAVKAFGGELFSAVFDGELGNALRSSLDEVRKQRQGLRIRLRLNDAPELVNLPWEYLYNPSLNRFLSLSVNTPIIRYLELPERITPLPVKLPLRVLAVISSPFDYPKLDVEHEWNNLKAALDDLERRGVLVLDRMTTASPTELQSSLRRNKYHIFHFIGHGGFNKQAQDGILLFEDDSERGHPLSGQYLGTLLHDEDTLRLAVLNACEGCRSGTSDPFAGVAQSLVQQGLPAVIGMQFEVTDMAAITFAREFYTAIADGYPVDAALGEARKAIFSLGNDIEWGTPVLYMRAPDGLIFDVTKLPEHDQAPPPSTGGIPHTHPPDEDERVSAPSLAAEAPQADVEQIYIDGLSAYWLQDWAKAWVLFRQVVDLDPTYQDTANKMEEVKEQLTKATLHVDTERALQASDWAAALKLLEKLVDLDPGNKDALSKLEQVRIEISLSELYAEALQLHQAEQWSAVINVFDQIEIINPDYPDPDLLLSSAQQQVAEIESKEKLKELFQQALQAMEAGRWQDANDQLVRVIAIEPNYNGADRLIDRVSAEIKKDDTQLQPQEQPSGTSRTSTWPGKAAPSPAIPAETVPAVSKRLTHWGLFGLGGLAIAVVLGGYLIFGKRGSEPPRTTVDSAGEMESVIANAPLESATETPTASAAEGSVIVQTTETSGTTPTLTPTTGTLITDIAPTPVPRIIEFSKHTIDNRFLGAISVFVTDLDTDGDVDILGAALAGDEYAWWENDGDLNFTKHTVAFSDGAHAIAAYDIDGDSDIDLLGAAHYSSQFTLWENDGFENFNKIILKNNIGRPRVINADDIDLDGDLDILGAAVFGNSIIWWENEGGQGFLEHTLSLSFDGASSVHSVDIDLDGDMDIIGTAWSGNKISYWENDGNENFMEVPIATDFNGALSAATIDLDGDGDIDVVGAAELANEIAWWEQNEDGTFSKHTITDKFGGAAFVIVEDLDNDQDIDVIGASQYDNKLTWWQNNGNQEFTEYPISEKFESGRALFVYDMDEDGDIDILGAAPGLNEIAWWEQLN